jgi:hypothetical protein
MKTRLFYAGDSFRCDDAAAMLDPVRRVKSSEGFENNYPALPKRSFTAPVTSDYDPSKQDITKSNGFSLLLS